MKTGAKQFPLPSDGVKRKVTSVDRNGPFTTNRCLFATCLSVIVLLLTGCTSTHTRGNYVEPGKLAQIKIGQTPQAEVESLLGEPISSRKSHGQKVLIYQQTQFEHREMVVDSPLSESLAGKSRLTFDQIRIFIGEDGKVADIKQISGDSHRTGAFVHDDYPKPDMTRVDEIQPGVTTQEQLEGLLGAPPFMSMSLEGNARVRRMWNYTSDPFACLIVYVGKDGLVDEVQKCFKGARWFPKRVDPDKVAQIIERQSTRKVAESVLGRPSAISRNAEGSFYIYYIKVGGTKEEVYIECDENGLITRLIRKPLPKSE